MDSEQLKRALDDIEQKQRAADYAKEQAIRLILGRLRKVRICYLRRLKAEIRDFNMTTGVWKP